MFSDAPPSREDVTISRTWREWVEVKTLTSSGMMAPASVPQVMTLESFHHSVVSPPRSGIIDIGDHVGGGDRNDRSEPHQEGQRRFVVELVGVAIAALAMASLMK